MKTEIFAISGTSIIFVFLFFIVGSAFTTERDKVAELEENVAELKKELSSLIGGFQNIVLDDYKYTKYCLYKGQYSYSCIWFPKTQHWVCIDGSIFASTEEIVCNDR